MKLININAFISKHITKRNESFFKGDIEANQDKLHREIYDKSVLVIGGAGTIGSSFIDAILAFKPNKLVVVDTNENGLTELTRHLRSQANQFIPAEYIPYPMDFGSSVFEKMFFNEGPFDIVANFAAHKHVRSEKNAFSIEAMIENNIFKAKRLLDLLKMRPPAHFFCVSTDKAANPVNVMGATKKIMEEVIMAYSNEFPISTARFANVAFSNGSLLDGYIYRLMKNQPISCPSDVKRFFVSPEESGQICMLACVLGKSGEIFFPKLKEDQLENFKEITEDFFREMDQKINYVSTEKEAKEVAISRKQGDSYPVYFFKTDTSGEKLFEEFYAEEDEVEMNEYIALGIIKNAKKSSQESIGMLLADMKSQLDVGKVNKDIIVKMLQSYIPNFAHIETGKKLDDKM